MGGQWKEDDAVKVFRSRRPTLFSLGLTELPAEPRAKAGFGRQRRG